MHSCIVVYAVSTLFLNLCILYIYMCVCVCVCVCVYNYVGMNVQYWCLLRLCLVHKVNALLLRNDFVLFLTDILYILMSSNLTLSV